MRFYEECVIDGVLCWRDSPDGGWTQKTTEELTEMLIWYRQNLQRIVMNISGDLAPQIIAGDTLDRREPGA